MGTRSNIAYANKDNEVFSSYCHYDGYIEHNGVMLLKHYNGEKQARDLVDNGYMSALKPTIEQINEGRVHKDKPTEYNNEFLFMDELEALWVEFVYLFKEGKWYVAESDSIKTPQAYNRSQWFHTAFKPLDEVVSLEMMDREAS
tara:strand:- start:37 stop:468 length:432 start_codon:yes stop_codon:yes gene_type:complete